MVDNVVVEGSGFGCLSTSYTFSLRSFPTMRSCQIWNPAAFSRTGHAVESFVAMWVAVTDTGGKTGENCR